MSFFRTCFTPWDFSHYCDSVKDCKEGYTCVRFYHYYNTRDVPQWYWPFYCRYNMKNIEDLESVENYEISSSSQSSSQEYN